ncbi:MAG: hypothetical protein ACKPKO_11670, partial [Candidatus Fonsibacter sp.]
FALDSIYDDEHLQGTMWLVNPAFVISDWKGDATNVHVTVDGEMMTPGRDFRSGLEVTSEGRRLVVWLNRTIDLNAREEHRAEFSVGPAR